MAKKKQEITAEYRDDGTNLYHFPEQGVTIRAASRTEAIEKLEKITSKKGVKNG